MAEGESLREICRSLKDQGCPSASTIVQRCIEEPDNFGKRYARARELQCEVWADRIIEEATTPRLGKKTRTLPNGDLEVSTGDAVDRSRLAVDALKWTLAKLHPKKYGEKISQEITGADRGPLLVRWEE